LFPFKWISKINQATAYWVRKIDGELTTTAYNKVITFL
jgi:hypothetical protein